MADAEDKVFTLPDPPPAMRSETRPPPRRVCGGCGPATYLRDLEPRVVMKAQMLARHTIRSKSMGLARGEIVRTR